MKTLIMFSVLLVSQLPLALAGYYDEANLAKLQKRYSKATADPIPWSGYWFPYADSGIAARDRRVGGLSPTEKLDAALGYPNSITGWEYANHGPANAFAKWWGHCNGWAVASIMDREPRAPRSAGGVKFEIGDLKAILAEYWLEAANDFIGTRVQDPNDLSSYAFWDVVPAQFYLLLTNVVGRQHRSLILDRYTGAEVWNQPLVAYETSKITPDDYLGPDPRYPDVYRVKMTTTLYWASDEVYPEDVMPEFEWREDLFYVKRVLRYELWVDAPLEFDSKGELTRSGNVILSSSGYGGVWQNGMNPTVLIESHPDFMWIPTSYSAGQGVKNPYINDAWVRRNLIR